jgi:hypothetical protein
MKSQKKVFESRIARTMSMNELFGVLDDNRQEEAWAFVLFLLEAQENEKETGEDQVDLSDMTATEVEKIVDRMKDMTSENRRGLIDLLSRFCDLMDAENQ